jgi:hypothetical protein
MADGNNEVLASDIKFLDPLSCGSTVGYYIARHEYKGNVSIDATVALSDCSRKLEWMFDGDRSITKINIALQVLNDFKKAFIKAKKLETKGKV